MIENGGERKKRTHEEKKLTNILAVAERGRQKQKNKKPEVDKKMQKTAQKTAVAIDFW